MAGKALLVGAAVGSLEGVEYDVDAIQDLLKARGMSIDRVSKQDATRANILEAYERLIATVEPGEAAVFYYSGHGGSTEAPTSQVPGPSLMDLQFIVPVDFPQSKPGDFRGITSVELSVLLARLTQRTDNATVILDCCHSGRMSRDPDLRVKAVDPQPYELLREHIDRLQREGLLDLGLLDSAGNSNAVRIVACAPDKAAYEYQGDEGHSIGMLTESLTLAMREAAGVRISWATVLDQVRRRVLTLEPAQRPGAEGPARRVLFETTPEEPLDSLRVTDLGDRRARLESAALLGVRRGDAFVVMPPDASDAADHSKKVADLTVTGTGSFSAVGTLTFAPGQSGLPLGARAYRVETAAAAMPVLLPGADPRAAQLAQAIAEAPLLRVAEPEDRWHARVVLGENGELTIEDRSGPLHAPRPGATGVQQVVQDLTALARATALRALTADSRWSLRAPIVLEWGRVEQDARQPLPTSGATIRVGEFVYISVRNTGQVPVYVSLVDIGVSGKISVLTDFAADGVALRAGEEYVYGFEDYDGVLTGVSPTWPEGLDAASARPETVLLLVTAAPHDISALAQDGVRGAVDSPLGALLRQISTGQRHRELGSAPPPAARYDVHVLDFELDPVPNEGGFLVDERADPAARLRAARTRGARRDAPATVAVRIDELIIHRNRALFGADVRLDAIVLTGSAGSARPSFRTRTERFSGIRNGEPLPLDRMLVYHGPAVDYLDIALWVCRDDRSTLDLGELLTGELANVEVQEALTKLGGAMTAVPYAAAAATAVGVGAVVVNLAFRLLRRSVSDVIGLYRGSRLADERFGAGRHPMDGVRRIQDFSLAYSIEEVS